ncbi:hypothetical protein ABZU76_19610 [Amycolatopsis sp. NPDC005232]|uniref:hypothetical protein n=1 Tax=Amycolatopsis sp. NPDC005232 TaxID=3157027 RepID=UPI0033AD3611
MAEQGAPGVPASGLNFVVTGGPASAGGGAASGAGAAATSGGFYLSPEDLKAELQNLEKLSKRIDDQLRNALPLWTIQSPGQDPASLRNTKASNTSGDYYRGHLSRQKSYVDQIIEQMQKALGIHVENDVQTGVDIKKQGEGHL